MVRQLDLIALAVALPVFLFAGWPMLGYVVAAGAWLAQRAIHAYADRRVAADLASGNRRGALGITAFSSLSRVWLLALAVLLVGKIAEREDGLAAAVLAAVLVTAYFAGQLLSHMFSPEEPA